MDLQLKSCVLTVAKASNFMITLTGIRNTKYLVSFTLFSRYLHFLRHYREKRLEAGYHKLDKSKLKERDSCVENMYDLEGLLTRLKGKKPY